MAFALTKFQAFGKLIDSPISKRYIQQVVMTITQANTDTALDIGTNAGTFWTAAKANGTYGAVASSAYDKMIQIAANAESFLNLGGTITDYPQVEGQNYDYGVIESAASVGGSPKESMTVTGLLASDTVLAVTPSVVSGTQKKIQYKYTSAASAGGAASETLVVTGLLASDTVLAVTPNEVGASLKKIRYTFESTAGAGGAATEIMVLTGLLATDTILAVTQKTVGANSLPLLGYTTLANDALTCVWSANPGAGAVVLVAVERTVAATGYYPIVKYSNLANDALKIYWPENPGAGAKVDVYVERTITIAGYLPIVAFDTPGANTLNVHWSQDPGAGAKVKVHYRRAASTAGATYSMAISNKRPNITFVSGGAPTSSVLYLSWIVADEKEAVFCDLAL
jgi:hypothetical protein